MKKILGITMAAVCALSVAAFGISACGSKEAASDEVTAEEWAAALTESNFYNVTANITITETDKTTGSDGNEEAYNYIASGEVKVAFTAADGYVTGNTYIYHTGTDSYTSSVTPEDNYSETESATQYEVFTAESYSYVIKESYTDGTEDNWSGYQRSSAYAADYSDAYETAGMLYDLGLEEAYSYFTYSDGAYRYSLTEGDEFGAVVVKINDGYVSYFSIEVKYEETTTWSGVDYTDIYSYKYEFSYSDYGTTSVTVPEEYTYEYYLANHAD